MEKNMNSQKILKQLNKDTLQSLILASVFLLAAFLLALDAQRAKNDAEALRQNVTISLEAPLTREDAQALCARESETALAAWGEQADITVTDPELGRRAQTSVITVCGAPSLVLPAAAGLPADDTGSCLITEQTAWELFGSTQAAGSRILVNDRTLTVLTVLPMPKTRLVICGSADADSSCPYNRITLAGTHTEDGEAFLQQNSLDGALLRLDYLQGPGWLTELVPGKWSDFSGWKENWKQKQQDITHLSQAGCNSLELCFKEQCRILAIDTALELACVAAAAACLLRCLPRRK